MSEVRLIDANALKEDLRRYFTDEVLDGVSARLAFNQILHDIDNAPTVEQEVYMTGKDYDFYIKGYKDGRKDFERPKGHWIRRPQGHYVCSLCEKGMYKSDFCPSCGADMRGKEE